MIRRARPALILLGVWIAALLVSNPRGDFPMCDDWCYASSVRTLMQTGEIHYCNYVQATIFSHVMWGSLFTWVSHFSFTALHISTLTLSAVAIVSTWLLARDVGASPGTAAFLAATLAANPVGFMLSNTFMTDVPYQAWSTLSALLLCRALRRSGLGVFIAASLICAVAILLRQFGLFLPVMFVPAFVLYRGVSLRNIGLALIPIAATVVAMQSHQLWMDLAGRRPEYYAHFMQGLDALVPLLEWRNWIDPVKRLLNVSFHASWYLFPAVLWTTMRPETRRGRVWLAGVVGVAVALVLVSGKVAPWGSSVLFDIGVGPPMLRDGDSPFAPVPHAPHLIWVVWTLAATVSGALFVTRMAAAGVRFFRQPGSERTDTRFLASALLLLAGAAVLSCAAMSVLQFYDRYLLAATALLIVACGLTARMPGSRPMPFARPAAVVSLALMAAFAVASTHDEFEWNRAKWAALQPLVDSRIYPLDSIDGGYEFRGWYSYRPLPDWQRVVNPRAVVAFGDMPGFTECSTYPYRRWMPPRADHLVLLVPDGQACPALK